MSLLGSNLYCVPYDAPARCRRKPRKPRMSIEERLLNIIANGRRITTRQAVYELQLDDDDGEDQVFQAICDCGALGLNFRWGTRLKKRVPVYDIVPIEEER